VVTGGQARGNQARLILTPIAPAEREPVLDALRGFAILGILLVNIEAMRSPSWLDLLGGFAVAEAGVWNNLVRFTIGWLAAAKFLSSLAILFGVGAALIASRALERGESPHALLARRYLWMLPFGLAHMLLFPGDILFLYGLTGLALLPFVRLGVVAALSWSAALLVFYGAIAFPILTTPAPAVDSAETESAEAVTQPLHAQALAALNDGSLTDMLSAHASQALFFQPLQLAVLPWILALFLFGFAIARAGILSDLAAHRSTLRIGAVLGLALGLPANFALGFYGPLPGWGPAPADEPAWLTTWTNVVLIAGSPVLAVGYLCTIALVCMRRGTPGPLEAVGRMALTAYILESALVLAAFGGLRLYDKLTTASALLVVAGIWALLLIFCPLWLRRFRMGPVEWLWRSLTYGRPQPLLASRHPGVRRDPS
jgi:uncharacterized protein